jgi:hypothetical protein
VSRSLRRLARVTYAFGPLSAALFQVLGASAEDACFEDELGLGAPPAIRTDRFVQMLEQALDAAGIPYALSSDDVARYSFKHARWTIVACPGALDPDLVARIVRARERGRAVTVGPQAPLMDASFRPLAEPHVLATTPGDAVPALLPFDEAAIVRAVVEARQRLDLPSFRIEPEDVRVTVHADARGVPRVMFVINATEHEIRATVTAAGAREGQDVLDGALFRTAGGVFEVTLPPRNVRMLELRQ